MTLILIVLIMVFHATFIRVDKTYAFELYVATDGSDTNEGTISSPFATLDRARDEIRKLRRTVDLSGKGVKVLIRGGNYDLVRGFVLTEVDSGYEGYPIVYQAFLNEDVRLTGGSPIKSFKKISDTAILKRLPESSIDKILASDIKEHMINDLGELKHRGMEQPVRTAGLELFFNGRPMQLSRWPNNEFVFTGKVIDTGSRVFSQGSVAGIVYPHQQEPRRPGKFKFENQRLLRWKSADDIWVHGYFGRDWSDEHIKVKYINHDSMAVLLAEPTRYGHYSGKRFYFMNLLEEIDMPGEWYLDRRSWVLYFWPPTPIEEGNAYISVLDEPLISIKDASYVIFKNITIEISRGDGIQINGGTGNTVAKCTIRNIGNRGVSITGGKNNGVTGCEIYDTGDGAIQISGGDRKTLTPANHYAEYNHIYRYSRWCRTYRPAVSLVGVGNRMLHNKIHDGEHLAILLDGNDHLVEYNEIHDVVKETTDAGALYIRFNPTFRGNIVRYNYFHHIANTISHIGQFGVYIDDGASDVLIHGNIFYLVGGGKLGAAIQINGGKENRIENNLFVNCSTCVNVIVWKSDDWIKFVNCDLFIKNLEEVNAFGPKYITSYPALKNIYQTTGVNKIRNNIAYSCSHLVFPRGEKTQEVTDNFIDNDSDLSKKLNTSYELKYTESISNKDGFLPIPFDMIGLSHNQKKY